MGRGGRSVAGRMGKGRERRREAGRRPVVARPGARALGSARCVPRGTPTPAQSLRTSCTLHCATRILYSSLDTVHLALYSALTLHPSTPHRTQHSLSRTPHSIWNTVHPARLRGFVFAFFACGPGPCSLPDLDLTRIVEG